MIEILIVLAIVLSLALIVLVTIQPRQNQLFSMDATSNIGKPSYWQSNTLVKVLTLLVSLALFILLLTFMVINLQIKEKLQIFTFCDWSEVFFLLSIFLVKSNFYLDEGFCFT